VYDWEYAGWGVSNIDLAQYISRTASPDLAVYRSAVEPWTALGDDAQILRFATCGGIFRLLEAMHWASLGLAHARTSYLAEPVSELRSYSRRLPQLLHEMGWVTTPDASTALRSASVRAEPSVNETVS
jgi:hypothetical protein